MRITQPFVGSGMKRNSLDPPPTISYFEQLTKLLGSATQSLFFFLSSIATLLMLILSWLASLASIPLGTIFFFFFFFVWRRGNKQKIPTAQRWRADTHSTTRSFLFTLFLLLIGGIQKRTQNWETFLFFSLLSSHFPLVFLTPTYLIWYAVALMVCPLPDAIGYFFFVDGIALRAALRYNHIIYHYVHKACLVYIPHLVQSCGNFLVFILYLSILSFVFFFCIGRFYRMYSWTKRVHC